MDDAYVKQAGMLSLCLWSQHLEHTWPMTHPQIFVD